MEAIQQNQISKQIPNASLKKIEKHINECGRLLLLHLNLLRSGKMSVRPLLNALICVGINIMCYFSLNIYKELSVISFLATQGVVVFLVFICDIISEEIENKTVEDLIAGNLSSNNRKASLIERKLGQFKSYMRRTIL